MTAMTLGERIWCGALRRHSVDHTVLELVTALGADVIGQIDAVFADFEADRQNEIEALERYYRGGSGEHR